MQRAVISARPQRWEASPDDLEDSGTPIVINDTVRAGDGDFKRSVRQCVARLDLGPSRGLTSGLIRGR